MLHYVAAMILVCARAFTRLVAPHRTLLVLLPQLALLLLC
jgi:hypothetical protein